MEFSEIVVGDVEVVQVANALQDVLLHLRDAVVTDIQAPERSEWRQQLVVQLRQLVEREVEDLQLWQVEDGAVHGVGDQLVPAEVEFGQRGHVGKGFGRNSTYLC